MSQALNVHYNSKFMYQNIYNDLNVGDRTVLWIGCILLLVIGIGLMFYGRKLFQKLVAISAFMAGFMLPLFIRASFSSHSNLYDVNWKIYGPICVIVGLLLFLLVWCVFMAAVIIIGSIAGAVLGKIVFNFLLIIDPNLFHTQSNLQYYNIIFIACGVIVVLILMYYLYQALLILLTPLIGSIFFMSGVMFIIEQISKKYAYGSYNHWWNYEKQFQVYNNIHHKYDNFVFWTMITFYVGLIVFFFIGFFYQSKIHPYELVVQNEKNKGRTSSKSYDDDYV